MGIGSERNPGRPAASRVLLVVSALALLAAGCGSGTVTAGAEAGPTSDDTVAVAPDEMLLEGAWARSSPANAENGAAYLTIASGSDDRLLAVSVDPSVADGAELHETVEAASSAGGGGSMAGMDHEEDDAETADTTTGDTAGDGADVHGAGAMTMRELSGGLELPAGRRVTLEPGGYHIMLLGLTTPLEAGSEFELTLEFETAGEKTVTVAVRDDAP